MTVDFPTMPRFAAMCDEMAALTGRERSVVVRNVARDFCWEALKRTPMAAGSRPPAQGPVIVVLSHRFTHQIVKFPGTVWQALTYGHRNSRRIPNRGFAKAGWIGCLKKLGASPRSRGGDQNPEKRTGEELYNEVLKLSAGDLSSIEVANTTPPIGPLDRGGPSNPPHNIGEQAMRATVARMERSLERLRAKQEARWR